MSLCCIYLCSSGRRNNAQERVTRWLWPSAATHSRHHTTARTATPKQEQGERQVAGAAGADRFLAFLGVVGILGIALGRLKLKLQ